MRTTLLLNQHKRCECILEMIEKCDQRIADYKQSIAFHTAKLSVTNIVEHYYQRWQITLAIKERLTESYSKSISKLIERTVSTLNKKVQP